MGFDITDCDIKNVTGVAGLAERKGMNLEELFCYRCYEQLHPDETWWMWSHTKAYCENCVRLLGYGPTIRKEGGQPKRKVVHGRIETMTAKDKQFLRECGIEQVLTERLGNRIQKQQEVVSDNPQ